jgi:prolyl 4-hydroxylase
LQVQHPRLFTIDDFASPEETARIVELASDRAQLDRHAVSWERDSASFVAELQIASDPLLGALATRMSELVGLANDPDATLRLRAYVEGEAHPLHSDAYTFDGLTLVATAMLYVLEPEAGGGTRFPAAQPEPLTVTPRRGRLLVWFSLREDGSIDPAAVHEALPVEAGYKIVLNDFFYAPLNQSNPRNDDERPKA